MIDDELVIYYSITCRYLIEIGSGAGYKTVMFASEFRVIGVDFKSNVVLGRKLHPAMQFIDADLDVSSSKGLFTLIIRLHLRHRFKTHSHCTEAIKTSLRDQINAFQ